MRKLFLNNLYAKRRICMSIHVFFFSCIIAEWQLRWLRKNELISLILAGSGLTVFLV